MASSRFIHEMRAAGLGDLTFEQLVEASIHGVRPDYIREMRDGWAWAICRSTSWSCGQHSRRRARSSFRRCARPD